MIRTHTFNGRKYKIDIGPFDGSCVCYTCEREMHILVPLEERIGLETAIHEALHACSWPASESTVEITAHDIARFLWRIGYRIDDKL